MQREGLNCFLCTYIYIHMNAEAYIIQHSHIVRKFKEHFPDLPGYVGHFPPNPNNCSKNCNQVFAIIGNESFMCCGGFLS